MNKVINCFLELLKEQGISQQHINSYNSIIEAHVPLLLQKSFTSLLMCLRAYTTDLSRGSIIAPQQLDIILEEIEKLHQEIKKWGK